MSASPFYNRAKRVWVPRCPHGDVCSGCDARGYCTRAEGAEGSPNPSRYLHFGERMPDDAPNRWVDPQCRYCKPGEPCLTHDRRAKTLAQNRVIFGPSFGAEPSEDDHREANFPW